ncbi:MAG: hypothetical protein PHN92_15460 [Geobacter sp.]|nr:hypothetical protein [Geobacter sp.]
MHQLKFSGISGTIIRSLHHADYAWLLPLLARLPLGAGYQLARLRGEINARLGRDWRSMALETRHVARQSAVGYRILRPQATEQELQSLVQERFRAESLEEFEGCLMAAGRVAGIRHEITPPDFTDVCKQRDRGLVLLTPHFDSFWLGTVFLAQAGMKVNAMTSAVTHDQRVMPAVQRHFYKKYRGMERLLNGGRMLNMEEGLRPFYQMLERKECLVILADAPATANSSVATPHFLGCRRQLAGGALRLARKTGSVLGAFVCRYLEPGHYLVKGGPIISAEDPCAFDVVYRYLSEEIEAAPGRWEAADLLPLMTPVDSGEPS